MPKLGLVATLVSLAILGALVAYVDPRAVLAALHGVSAVHVIAGLVLVELQILLSAWRWRFTAGRLGQQISLALAIREYFVGSLVNQSLPGGMAGDALRAFRGRAGGQGGWKKPAEAVLFERLSGQLAFMVLTALGLAAWPLLIGGLMPEGLGRLALPLGGLLMLAVLIGFFMWRGRAAQFLDRMKPDLAAVFWHDGAFKIQLGCSTAIVASYIACFLIASDAVGASLPPVAAFTAIPICLLTMLIPAGIGGWGSREAAAAALWPIFGFSAAQGLSASLLYGLLALFGALPGLVVLLHAAWQGRLDRAA